MVGLNELRHHGGQGDSAVAGTSGSLGCSRDILAAQHRCTCELRLGLGLCPPFNPAGTRPRRTKASSSMSADCMFVSAVRCLPVSITGDTVSHFPSDPVTFQQSAAMEGAAIPTKHSRGCS